MQLFYNHKQMSCISRSKTFKRKKIKISSSILFESSYLYHQGTPALEEPLLQLQSLFFLFFLKSQIKVLNKYVAKSQVFQAAFYLLYYNSIQQSLAQYLMQYKSKTGSDQDQELQKDLEQFLISYHKKALHKKLQIIETEKPKIQEYKVAIGVLNSILRSKNHIIICTNIATAFLVALDLIITSISNVYFKSLRSYAQEFQFVPGINILRGEKPSSKNIFKAHIINKTSQIDLAKVDQDLQPTKEELVLLKLQRHVKICQKSLLTIGNLDRIQFGYKSIELAVVGYPSLYFQSPKFRQNGNMKLVERYGPLEINLKKNAKNHLISYHIQTQSGMIGSPILAMDKEQNVVVVGIHTHCSKNTSFLSPKSASSSGLHFTDQILSKIKTLQEKVYLQNISQGICQKKIQIYQERKTLMSWEEGSQLTTTKFQTQKLQRQSQFQQLNRLLQGLTLRKQEQNFQKAEKEVVQHHKHPQSKNQRQSFQNKAQDILDSSQQYQNRSQLSLDETQQDFL